MEYSHDGSSESSSEVLDTCFDHNTSIGVANFMQPQVYRALTSGDIDFFQRGLDDLELSLLDQASPRGDTALHVAVLSSHDAIVGAIVGRYLELVGRPNSTGDLPLHVAAASGRISMLTTLLSAAHRFQCDYSESTREATRGDHGNVVTRHRNKEGNTALHLALRNRHEEAARLLFEADPEVTHFPNSKDESPLYMAAEAGYVNLFQLMIESSYTAGSTPSDSFAHEPLIRHKLVRAALCGKRRGILNVVMRVWPDLFKTYDSEGMHPLSYAALVGYHESVHAILKRFPECSYLVNKNGFYPIHLAAIKGYVRIIEEFLRQCPDTRELRNRKNQNILHLAAENGKVEAVKYILRNPELQILINERDWQGNTPLHLASDVGQAKVVSVLTWDSRVKLEMRNDQGLMALDVAENFTQKMPSFREGLTWLALRHAGAPSADQQRNTISPPVIKSAKPEETLIMDFFRNSSNTLMVVATLILSMVFSSGFYPPGDYDYAQDNSQDFEAFVRRCMFSTFVVGNTLGFCSTIIVVVVLIWSQLGDYNLVLASVRLALPLMALSLSMVCLAQMAGAYLNVQRIHWLGGFVLFIGLSCLIILFLLLAPLYFPTSLNRPVARYIFRYPLYLLIEVALRDN